ncbi:MAG: protein translocase subunit SecD, partial [Chloroflexota bacterium]|nr:protein translocase subunit SecD [Chloroflexota bacterium]
MNRRYFITLAFIIVFVTLASYVNLPDNPGLNIGIGNARLVRDLRYHLGLDLQGGLHVVLRATPAEGQNITSDHMEATRDIIAERVNALGVSEPIVQL